MMSPIPKLIEECGELLQVLGKREAGGKPPKGQKNMTRALEAELADVLAAIDVVIERNDLDRDRIAKRRRMKFRKGMRRTSN